ncbi:MAG TPA: hypothetical protein VGQ41_01395 [Pyrinomonadaceae bacterium]|jgi:hypothetical protein|nr:hypothetical protein [Pyrinomonadaceae bacterium]
MLKKLSAFALTTMVVIGIPAQSVKPMPQTSPRIQGIRLQNGRLYLNQELIYKNFSLVQTSFRYLYFYVPQHGLFTVSNREFEGAIQNGVFEGPALNFSVNDLNIALKSSSQILPEDSSPAWIKFDPNFKLDVKSVIFGYGDKERSPYDWPDQIRKNQQ